MFVSVPVNHNTVTQESIMDVKDCDLEPNTALVLFIRAALNFDVPLEPGWPATNLQAIRLALPTRSGPDDSTCPLTSHLCAQ